MIRHAGIVYSPRRAHRLVVWLMLVNMSASQLFVFPGAVEWLVHIGDVVTHYEEHRTGEPNLTFFQFFRLHFGDLAHDHEDEHDHSDLPFRCHHTEVVFVSLQVIIPVQSLLVMPPQALPSAKVPAFSGSLLSFDVIADIWQPPRFC